MPQSYYLAIDIGASSGRHILGWIENGKIRIEEIHRFQNGIVGRNGHLCWDVDLVILQLLTYATSYNMLPAVKDLDVPVILVNVQKKKVPDYQHTDIPTWLGTLYACGAVGEMAADRNRYGKRHAVITGVVEGGDPEVQREIADWCRAARRSIRSGIWQSMWSHSSSGHRRNGSVWSRPTMTAMRRGRQENSTAC